MSPENLTWGTYILSALISTFISAVVSLLLNKFFTERSRKMRDHSIILNNKSLKIWLEKINEICIKGAKYSHEDKKIIGLELGDLKVVPHYQSLESHMKSGHPKEWGLWEVFRNEVKRYNGECATILEDIRQKFLQESKNLDLTEFYPQPGKITPENYVRPNKIAEEVLKEVENRLSGIDKWWGGKPRLDYFIGREDIKFHRLNVRESGEFIYDVDRSKVIFCLEFILSMVETPEIIQGSEKLSKIEGEIRKKRDNFENELKKLISYIELGNNLRGNCDVCSF